MAWFKKKPKEARDFTLKQKVNWFVDWLGVNKTSSGETVTEETATTLTAVWSAVKLLSESVAGLPVQVFTRNGNSKDIDRENPVYTLLHSEPNPYMTSFLFHQTMMSDVLLWGNAYARIHRDSAYRVKWLEIIPPSNVTVEIKGKKWFKVEGLQNKIADRDMIHVVGLSYNGVTGKSPIQVCKEAIGLGLAAEKFGGNFFGNGANMTGVLEAPFAMTPDQSKQLSKSWDQKNSGNDKSGGTAILEGGLKYQRIGIPPDQAQFIATRKFQVNEIARMFNVPPHLIGDLERSTNNNIEQQSIEFVTYSLLPWVKRFEQEYNRKLFKEDEKGNTFAEFNLSGLLRGDVVARAQYYKTMWEIGAFNDNEIRALENKNPYKGGDQFLVPMNMTTTDKIGQDEQGNEGI